MTVETHLLELERRHRALEAQIAEAQSHSSSDDLEIAELKRQKLHLKEDIERLRHQAAIDASSAA